MSKSKLESWLDAQIEARDVINTPFNDDIYTIDNTRKSIHLGEYKVVAEMAETLGLEVSEVIDRNYEYPYMISFMYKGYEVFALTDMEEY